MQPSTTISKSQRVFKFRAWDGEKMHYNVVPWQWDFVISLTWHRCEKSTGDGILGSGGKTGEFLVPGISFKNLMQFTGLFDKNKKEIYEGDFIKFLDGSITSTESGMDCDEFESVGEVFWCYDRKGWDVSNRHDVETDEAMIGDIEIVGNIYENPELLNP